MNKEYPCPVCEEPVKVDGHKEEVRCESCGTKIKVNYDADCELGRWYDLTTLHKV